MGRTEVNKIRSGDLCAIIGLDNFEIGDTLVDLENPKQTRISVDEPTMSMLFTINTTFRVNRSAVATRHLRDRLLKKLKKPCLRVETTDSEDKFNVFGRGILHLLYSLKRCVVKVMK